MFQQRDLPNELIPQIAPYTKILCSYNAKTHLQGPINTTDPREREKGKHLPSVAASTKGTSYSYSAFPKRRRLRPREEVRQGYPMMFRVLDRMLRGGGSDKVGSWYPGGRLNRKNVGRSYPMRPRLLAMERRCQLGCKFMRVTRILTPLW